jgi:hypothetical protein
MAIYNKAARRRQLNLKSFNIKSKFHPETSARLLMSKFQSKPVRNTLRLLLLLQTILTSWRSTFSQTYLYQKEVRTLPGKYLTPKNILPPPQTVSFPLFPLSFHFSFSFFVLEMVNNPHRNRLKILKLRNFSSREHWHYFIFMKH